MYLCRSFRAYCGPTYLQIVALRDEAPHAVFEALDLFQVGFLPVGVALRRGLRLEELTHLLAARSRLRA